MNHLRKKYEMFFIFNLLCLLQFVNLASKLQQGKAKH